MPKWDTVSEWHPQRKPCPRIGARNGMHFPDEDPCGKPVPECALRVGRAFRNPFHPESTSRSERQFWDTVSPSEVFGKARPILGADSGTQLPFEASTGNCVPLFAAALKAAIAGQQRSSTSPHITRHCMRDLKPQNSRKTALFRKSTRPETYQVFTTCRRSRVPIAVCRFSSKK